MKTIIPLTQPPNSTEWVNLMDMLDVPGAAAQATVIINPAGGPGPDKPWEERKHWLGRMAALNAMGARLALSVAVQDAEPAGLKYMLSARSPRAIREDVRVWRERYLAHLSLRSFTWWADFHPASGSALEGKDVAALYAATAGEHVTANVRTVPGAAFARACPASALCVHAGNGWPPMCEPTLGGKPVAVLACGASSLIPGAKRHATWLYATPAPANGGTFNTVSPLLPRILALNL